MHDGGRLPVFVDPAAIPGAPAWLRNLLVLHGVPASPLASTTGRKAVEPIEPLRPYSRRQAMIGVEIARSRSQLAKGIRSLLGRKGIRHRRTDSSALGFRWSRGARLRATKRHK